MSETSENHNSPFTTNRYIPFIQDPVEIPEQNVTACGVSTKDIQSEGFSLVQRVAENAYNAAI